MMKIALGIFLVLTIRIFMIDIKVAGITIPHQFEVKLTTALRILNNALERIAEEEDSEINVAQKDEIQEPIQYIIDALASNAAFLAYENKDLFEISKYFAKFYDSGIFDRLSRRERKNLDQSLKSMPSSFYNAVVLEKVCLRTKLYNNEYLLVIADDQKHVVRAVTLDASYRPLLKRSVYWEMSGLKKNNDNAIGLVNDAFQEHYHRSYLYNDQHDEEERDEALLFIGLDSPRPFFTTWTLHPVDNAFLIENQFTDKYLCAGMSSDLLIWFYRFTYAVSQNSTLYDEERCTWEVWDCEEDV